MFFWIEDEKPKAPLTCRACGAVYAMSEYIEAGLCQQCGLNGAIKKPDTEDE